MADQRGRSLISAEGNWVLQPRAPPPVVVSASIRRNRVAVPTPTFPGHRARLCSLLCDEKGT
uniref:Uncharacterized protein n=1 Tax=Setaria italica TaxID=4555 RepID=K3YXI3_SETIT